MTNFSWPHNLDQLQHVLKELIVITQTPYIVYQDVKHMLEQETTPSYGLPSANLDLHQTLDEINYQIIQTVLKEEHGKYPLENLEKLREIIARYHVQLITQ